MKNIELQEISKKYGELEVLNRISLKVEPRCCYCLLGKNGAGKSTLLNIVSDLIQPDSGALTVFGYDYQRNSTEIKRLIGVLPEHLPLVDELTGMQYLNLVGLFYSIDSYKLNARIESLVSYFFEETTFLQKRIESYSKGMKMKLAFCSVLLHKPQVLILDEPFNGWDPVSVNLLIEFLNSFLGEDRIILMSSHDLLYVDKVATHIGVLDKSKLIYNSSLQDFKSGGKSKIEQSLLNILQVESKTKSDIAWVFEK
jgi:ABC-type multidrug transport system, ATPase component